MITREEIKLAAEAVIGALAAFVMSLPPTVLALLVLQGMDVITGLMAGYITRTLDSNISYRGLMKKAAVIVLVAGSGYLGTALKLPGDAIVPTAIAGFYSMHEAVSILENLVRADLPLPQVLKNAIKQDDPDV